MKYLQLLLLILGAEFFAISALESQSPPLIVKQPPKDELLFQVVQRIDENKKPFIIECEAEGYPVPRYKWIKNGREFNFQALDDRIFQQPGHGTLVFHSPRATDVGQYQCFAFNEYGTATSNSVFVRMAELDSFKDAEAETIVADEGKPFSLPCDIPKGYPRPKGSWMLQSKLGALEKINSSRITVDPEGTLWFSYVTREDNSTEFNYACSIYSPFRNEYKLGNRVNLNVTPTSNLATLNKYPITTQYVTKRVTVAQRGGNIELWCILGGKPLPQIKWTKEGTQLPYDRIEYDNYGKTLRIVNVDFYDEGSYVCDATNGVGSPISYSSLVQVNAAPYFMVEPEVQNAAEGETVEFRCEAHGKPAPEIRWIHNGKPIEEVPSNPRRILNQHKITLKNIRRADSGNYGCNASNYLGYTYKDVYVNVLAYPPEIIDPPKDHVTTVSKTVIFTCRALGAPKPLVRWIRNELELTGGRFRVLDNGDLEVHNVGFVDAGSYRCLAENKFGNDSKTGNLVVNDSSQDTKNVTKVQFLLDSPNELVCRITHVPFKPRPKVSWMRNEQIISDSERILQDYTGRRSFLLFENVSERDAGQYTCTATYQTHRVEQIFNVTVKIQDTSENKCKGAEAFKKKVCNAIKKSCARSRELLKRR